MPGYALPEGSLHRMLRTVFDAHQGHRWPRRSTLGAFRSFQFLARRQDERIHDGFCSSTDVSYADCGRSCPSTFARYAAAELAQLQAPVRADCISIDAEWLGVTPKPPPADLLYPHGVRRYLTLTGTTSA